LRNWGSSSNGTPWQGAQEARNQTGKKKPFAHLTWKDVLVYLEQSQEADELSSRYRSRLLDDLPRTGDFFNLGTALFLQIPTTADRLTLTAWTKYDPMPPWSLELTPTLKLRLLAGIPQVLTGPEKADFTALSARWAPGGGLPVALPLVAQPRTLLGTLVLLDAPPFDLEDETFVLAWTQYKYTLIQSLQPRRKTVPVYSEGALMRTLESGHGFLAVELDTTELTAHCDSVGLPPHRVRLLVERGLAELTGPHGAILWRPPVLVSLFVLPSRMDEQLLWHQIEVSLKWPEGFVPKWTRHTVRTPQELQNVLGR